MSKRSSIPKKVEKTLYKEVNSSCPVCGQDNVNTLSIHHIEPYALTESHNLDNMIVLCANCHALADKKEINKETLIDIKNNASRNNVINFVKDRKDIANITGNGNIVSGGSINVAGDIKIKVQSLNSGRKQPIIVQGTLQTDARRYGYIDYLIGRYNEFKKWECDKSGVKMNYAMIRVSYKREIKYNVKDTPLNLFEKAVAYLQKRIFNTKLGRIRNKKGVNVFTTFDDFQ